MASVGGRPLTSGPIGADISRAGPDRAEPIERKGRHWANLIGFGPAQLKRAAPKEIILIKSPICVAPTWAAPLINLYRLSGARLGRPATN